jgi:hypothetical protein
MKGLMTDIAGPLGKTSWLIHGLKTVRTSSHHVGADRCRTDLRSFELVEIAAEHADKLLLLVQQLF